MSKIEELKEQIILLQFELKTILPKKKRIRRKECAREYRSYVIKKDMTEEEKHERILEQQRASYERNKETRKIYNREYQRKRREALKEALKNKMLNQLNIEPTNLVQA